MGYGLEKEDNEVVALEQLAPVFCPCCGTKLDESETGNRICPKSFPPCCYMYWNRRDKKHNWKEGYGPDDIYSKEKEMWLKKEPTETIS